MKINYPKFDSVLFINDNSSDFLANFQPDSSYTVIGACCGTMDIVASYRADHDSMYYWWEDYEANFGKIQQILLNFPNISLKLAKNSKDSIFTWHADMSCMSRLNLITTKKWNYGIPEKCFYWNNITTFIFYKNDVGYPEYEIGNTEDGFVEFPNDIVDVLTSITFRLFDNKNYLITYDPKSNKAVLKEEK